MNCASIAPRRPASRPAVALREHTLKIWQKHGIRQAGFWTVAIGSSNQDLYYLLEWESLAERERKWNAFASDPEWLAVKAETEKNGAIVETLSNAILTPTAFSSVR